MKKRFLVSAAFLFLICIVGFLLLWLFDFSHGDAVLGFTFSDVYAERELGLDPKETLRAMLDDLRPQIVRFSAYWDDVERTPGVFDFSALDAQMAEAAVRNIPVILAVGYRTPRWPECHIPDWAGDLSANDFHSALFRYLETTVLRYKDYPILALWQVENEPLLGVFGRCPAPDRTLLKTEVVFVKSKDPGREIMTTGSGELSLWLRTAGIGDQFGTTLYRHIWNKDIGAFTHVFPPAWYTFRAWVAERFLGTNRVMVAELQAEPWGEGKPLPEMSLEDQVKHFGTDELLHIAAFAQRTGLSPILFWGPEWWYWRKLHGDPSFWEAGKEIFAR